MHGLATRVGFPQAGGSSPIIQYSCDLLLGEDYFLWWKKKKQRAALRSSLLDNRPHARVVLPRVMARGEPASWQAGSIAQWPVLSPPRTFKRELGAVRPHPLHPRLLDE